MPEINFLHFIMKNLQQKLSDARGDSPCDLVIKNAKIVNVFSHEIIESSVAVSDGFIVGIGDYEGEKSVDANGSFLVPGFIEGHIHVESTLLPIPEFARAVMPHGTTSAVIDPHEIANVYGMDGIRYMLESAKTCPLDIFVMLPSCVPATPFESCFEPLMAEDLAKLIDDPGVGGIGELMNFPAVYNGDSEFLKRAKLGEKKVVDGHSPFLTGKNLNAYILAGIKTDHECTVAEEALEKLRLGMHVHLREGSTEHNLAELAKIVTPENSCNTSLVSDDRHPDDLLEKGHLDYSVRLAVENGIDPITAIQMVTINTARCYKLPRLGAIAPGFQADFFLTDNIEKCELKTVFKKGKNVADISDDVAKISDFGPALPGKSMNVQPLNEKSFEIKIDNENVRVINVVEHQILTKETIEKAPVENGILVSDVSCDLLKLAVVERHHATGRLSVGLVRGFGLKSGAIGSTVAHDGHNIIVAGVNDEDMLVAANALVEMGGGYVVVKKGKVIAKLPLPIAGLMSDKTIEEVVAEQKQVFATAKDELDAVPENPFMTLSFLSLTPIPELRLTDQGLFDARIFQETSLQVET